MTLKKLKELREKAGLSQMELAQRFRLKSAQSISNVERGTAPFPPHWVKPWARALKVDPMELAKIEIERKRQRYLERARLIER